MTAVAAVDSTCVAKPWPVPKALAEEDVLIRVVSTAINRLDTMQRRGKSPVPKSLALRSLASWWPSGRPHGASAWATA